MYSVVRTCLLFVYSGILSIECTSLWRLSSTGPIIKR